MHCSYEDDDDDKVTDKVKWGRVKLVFLNKGNTIFRMGQYSRVIDIINNIDIIKVTQFTILTQFSGWGNTVG